MYTNPATIRTFLLLVITVFMTTALLAQVQTLLHHASAQSSGELAFEQTIIEEQRALYYTRDIGDINEDGYPDIVSFEESPLRLLVYLYPAWTPVVLADGSSYPDYQLIRCDDIKLADIDADDDLDVVLRIGDSGDANGVVIWLENPRPDESFDTPWIRHDVGATHYVKDVAVHDIDKDGKLDIITRGSRSHSVATIWFQNSADDWEEKQVPIDEQEGMDTGDLDGDGDQDIVLNGYWHETPANPRSGTYIKHNIHSRWWTEDTGSWQDNSSRVAVADIDGNGTRDVVLSHSESTGFPVAWYSADDPINGPWTEHIITSQCDYCHNLQVADFNDDGFLDVLAGGMPQSQHRGLTLYLGDGGTTWTPLEIQNLGSYSAEPGDVSNDGDLDIITVRTWDQMPLEIWENQLTDPIYTLDEWSHKQISDAHTRTFGLDFTDIDGDGLLDILSGQYWYQNPGGDLTGSWGQSSPFPQDIHAMLAMNVDNDELADVIGVGDGAAYWLEAQNRQGTAWDVNLIDSNYPPTEHTYPQGYAVAQFIPDNKPEIILAAGGNPGAYYLYQIPSDPLQGEWPRVLVDDKTNSEGVGIGDIDGDGLLDIAIGHYPNGSDGTNRAIKWLRNPGDDTPQWEEHLLGKVDGRWPDRFAVADMNGDARLDIIVAEEMSSGLPDAKTYWFEAPADPTADPWQRHVVTTQYTTNNLDVADMDGDGNTDLILAEHDGTKKVAIWANDGTGAFTEHVVGSGKESHLGARTGDLDGDGDQDIVSIAYTSPQYVHLWRNDATPITPSSSPTPTAPSTPTPVIPTPTATASPATTPTIPTVTATATPLDATATASPAATTPTIPTVTATLTATTPTAPPTPTANPTTDPDASPSAPTQYLPLIVNNPFSRWSFNENSGTIAANSNPAGVDGTLQNGPTWEAGRHGAALRFDGIDDYVDLEGLVVGGETLTLMAWMQADSFAHTDARVISKASGMFEQDHIFMLSTFPQHGQMRLRFRLKTNGHTDTLIAASGNLPLNEWVHVAAVYNGSSMKLYQDGVLVGQRSKSGSITTSSTMSVWIGGNPVQSSDYYFDGLLDEVCVYGRALSLQEIQAIAEATSTQPPPTATP